VQESFGVNEYLVKAKPTAARRQWTIRVENIAQRRRGCSLSRVRVNGVIIPLRPGGHTGIVIL